MESSAPQFPPAEPPKNGNSKVILGIAAAVLVCCCCLAAVLAGLTFLGPMINGVFSSVNQGLENPGLPDLPAMTEIPFLPEETSIPADPTSPDVPSGLIPEGGRGDDLLRTDTWATVTIAAMLSECDNPNAAETTITITQDPDANGSWKELWTVACGDGKTVPVEVTFTPSASGGIDFSVTVIK